MRKLQDFPRQESVKLIRRFLVPSSDKIIQKQLAKAGIRLAAVLNTLLLKPEDI